MKAFNRFIIEILILFLIGIAGTNLYLDHLERMDTGRPYLVEIARMEKRIQNGENPAEIDCSGYTYIQSVTECRKEEDVNRMGDYPVCIRQINGVDYRIEYEEDNITVRRQHKILVNGIFTVAGGLLLCVMLYIRWYIIYPFHELEDVPVQLSKGCLTVPLKERKTKYFGKFIWGMNLLQEKLEDERRKELKFQRDEKTKMLALTHDVKTPLSVIKLNAQALEKGIYQEIEAQQRAASHIYQKTVEIEEYLTKLNELSKEEFLEIEVFMQEIYLSEIIEILRRYYEDKLSQLHTVFRIGEYQNCIIKADKERLLEVLQNIVENAIKYGSGKEIDISISQEDGCILITVTDIGESLPAEELPHIFDSFYRGTNAGSREGSGLGLYICRKLMHRMNGDVFAKQNGDVFAVTVVIAMAN